MSTFKENEHPRGKSGQFVDKHVSRKPDIELGQTFFSPQHGTFGEVYRGLADYEIPPIVGTQLKGDDGKYYEVSRYTRTPHNTPRSVITSIYTGVEADPYMRFDIEKLPTGELANAYMSKMENEEKKNQSRRDFKQEKEDLGVIDCKSPHEIDVFDGLIDAREAEVRVVDEDGNMHSTDGRMPSKFRRLILKYRMGNYWEIKENVATFCNSFTHPHIFIGDKTVKISNVVCVYCECSQMTIMKTLLNNSIPRK